MFHLFVIVLWCLLCVRQASLIAQFVKNLPAVQETRVEFLGWEDPLEKGMATHSSILAWKIPWTEEPGRLQFVGSQRIGHDLVTKPPPPCVRQTLARIRHAFGPSRRLRSSWERDTWKILYFNGLISIIPKDLFSIQHWLSTGY